MALDAAVLAELRSWVGSDPDDDDLEERYTRLEASVPATAIEVLRGRLADMIRSPAKFAADGDASYDYSTNLRFLKTQISELDGLVAGGSDALTVGLLTRSGTRR